MKISEILPRAARALADSGVPEHVRESSSLLQFVLNKDRVFLFSHPEYELTDEEMARFDDALARRVGREPLQYITGRQEFYGLEFLVTPNVLIPRPETEMLVAKSIELLGRTDSETFAEIGVGSGCISIAILANVPHSHAVGADISAAAIDVARKNAVDNNVSGRLELIESDVFAGFEPQRFDLVVSNPPYVAVIDIDGLQPEVRGFEPHTALTDGADGLSIIKTIIEQSPAFLVPGGNLLLEFGFGQAERVKQIFDPAVWSHMEILPDFQDIPRMLAAVLK
ncbi:MAG: peptide chain release factor N(5)-glutamine methyltransferase [Acidobacteriota bacterium]